MKRLIPLLFLAIATPAMAQQAQQPTFQQQVDSLTATITRGVGGLNSAAEAVAVQAQQTQQQLAAVTKERDDLKKQVADKDAEIARLKAPEPPKTP